MNLAGIPGVSVPVGDGRSSGLPVGLQLVGPMWSEQRILQAAWHVESALSS
jgi:aspartyl-tRNA(Asn)/glutamyl-tRNA(Gln) amidotransferase subunit A